MPKKHVHVEREPRVALEKNDETEYGLVQKSLGGSRFTVKLNLSDKTVIGKLCGKFRKGANKHNNIVDVGSVVLVGLREFDDKTAEIVYVYNQAEARQLRKNNKIFFEMKESDDATSNIIDDTGFDFDGL